ncbi:hypothetical protein [Maritalea sp.]|uniref:hypothetical protein n=1 Tax=Maritalea sp. TaxID=2003361 RepID=UPI003EF3B101
MSLADQLACALERNDEEPNIELAKRIAAKSENSADVLELFGIVANGNKAQKHDAIKVLYEVAAISPGSFDQKTSFLFDLLSTKDNRILWGSLTAIAHIGTAHPGAVFDQLDKILQAAERGSVIAKDRAVEVLVALAGNEQYRDTAMPKLLTQLKSAAPNQLPMYAEIAANTIPIDQQADMVDVLKNRLPDLPTPAKRKRVEKIIIQHSLYQPLRIS